MSSVPSIIPPKPNNPIEDRILSMQLLGGLLCLIALLFVGFYAIPSGRFPVTLAGWLAMLGSAVALIAKVIIADTIDGRLLIEKVGSDMCAMAMGTSLAALVSWAGIPSAGGASHTRILLAFVALAVISTGGVCLAGTSLRALVLDQNSPKRGLLIKTNATLGVIAIALNLFMYGLKNLSDVATATTSAGGH